MITSVKVLLYCLLVLAYRQSKLLFRLFFSFSFKVERGNGSWKSYARYDVRAEGADLNWDRKVYEWAYKYNTSYHCGIGEFRNMNIPFILLPESEQYFVCIFKVVGLISHHTPYACHMIKIYLRPHTFCSPKFTIGMLFN